jgi:hypothetical protein
VLALALVLVVAGCERVYPGMGTTLCGTHINTGAEGFVFEPLDPNASPPPGPAPTVSSLPLPSTANIVPRDYIRTSPNCATGAVVVVAPFQDARLAVTVPAKDGRITGIALVHITAPVTVSAWVDGRFQGSLTLQPDVPTASHS